MNAATMDIPCSYFILSRFQSLIKACFLPVYKLAIMSIVCSMAAGFTMVRFLRLRGQEN